MTKEHDKILEIIEKLEPITYYGANIFGLCNDKLILRYNVYNHRSIYYVKFNNTDLPNVTQKELSNLYILCRRLYDIEEEYRENKKLKEFYEI